jgi:hypothetical membrane protein
LRAFFFVFSLLLLLALVDIGLRRSARKDLGFAIAVISTTLCLVLVLYFFTTLYGGTHPLFFVLTFLLLIIIMLTIAKRIFKQ